MISNPPQRSFWHFNRLIFFLIDLTIFIFCVNLAFRLSPSNPYEWSMISEKSLLAQQAIFLPVCLALGLQLSNVQKLQAKFKRIDTIVRIIWGSAFGALAFIIFHALINFQLVGRYIILISWLLGIGSTFIARIFLWRLAQMKPRTILLWGSEQAAQEYTQTLKLANLPIYLIGRYEQKKLYPTLGLKPLFDEELPVKISINFQALETPSPEAPLFDNGHELTISELPSICSRLQVDSMILSNPTILDKVETRELTQLISQGIRVHTLNYFYEQEFERVHVPSMSDSWLWDHEGASTSPYYKGLKRSVDILLSLCALAILLPVIPLIAFLIWRQDRGPIFYSQDRIGLFGIPFRIYKFRTMRVDAESQGAQWAQKNDQRATQLGKWLRKSRLDEVPQFYNILRGDMSFVGPRPERGELAQQIEQELPHFRFRHLIKPGLSGWAQVNYGYGSNIDDARIKLSYDLYYLKHASLALDLLIILRTFGAMMKGAR
jgi:lipopolysaccharide/colanic/teichoic acid biosynthesis glycosyltransferase